MAAYKGSLKRFEFFSKIVLWFITILLSVFLIQLGDRILADINDWFDAPEIESFQDAKVHAELEREKSALDKKKSSLKERKYHVTKSLETAQRNYASEKKSFEIWLNARKMIGAPEEDTRIRQRASRLDGFRKVEEAWASRMSGLEDESRSLEKEYAAFNEKRLTIEHNESEKYNAAFRKYSIYLFLLRLAFVLPILVAGIYLFIRFRNSRMKPLIRGYVIFALYAFFVGLVPYLPSFGGYIRYSVGIALTIFAGIYVVKQLALFAEKKKAELQESTEERSKKIKHETALKAYLSHRCPSCEKDFLIKNWQPGTKIIRGIVLEDDAPSFCQHCGLKLFEKCPQCGTRNFSHFPYCSNCGHTVSGNSAESV